MNTSTHILTELHYLPNIKWFAQIFDFDTIVLEAHENFQKQTQRNRAKILGANGPLTITVPVLNGRSGDKIKMVDIQIDYDQPWNVTHWRTLVSSYANAPYFEYYAPDLEAIYLSRPRTLFVLNTQLLSFCLKCLRMEKNCISSDSYIYPASLYTKDVRSRTNQKESEAYPEKLKHFRYPQVFGKEFVSNLSIIDLLSNYGPDSSGYLKRISEDM